MSTHTKTYDNVGALRAALRGLPEGAVIKDRDGDVIPGEGVQHLEGAYAPYTVTYDAPEPVTIDPEDVKAGDTVTLDSDELGATVAGRVTDIQHDHGAWTIYLTLGVMGHSTPFVVGVGTSWRLTDHQPAPKPSLGDKIRSFINLAGLTRHEEGYLRDVALEADALERELESRPYRGDFERVKGERDRARRDIDAMWVPLVESLTDARDEAWDLADRVRSLIREWDTRNAHSGRTADQVLTDIREALS
jgi:hypothetical protein